ncbi:MAG: hypothetical protein ABI366_11300 [Ginsengibacter sp.]
MKYAKIKAYQVGLVFRNGAYKRMLKEGNCFLWNKEVQVYDITKQFKS